MPKSSRPARWPPEAAKPIHCVSDRYAEGDETARSTGSVERSGIERDRAARTGTPNCSP
ncbi:hypothetical protein OSJ57_23040 [Sphingomonas sp. HH69]